jgi:hypothetical protein
MREQDHWKDPYILEAWRGQMELKGGEGGVEEDALRAKQHV